MTDDLLGDRYILGPLLGRGGMAMVRRARDTRLERDVAIKLLKADLAGDPVFQERFRREAHAAAGLNHPNIVSVYDTGEYFDETSGLMIPYIVMELVQGHTLREILHDGRRIQPVKALELTQSVLNALDNSHRHGIIHRDIKPANVMLTTTGQVKVMDFGIARAVSDTAASMTQTASVIGTPQYLSPEQIRGETVDRRSDLYATGCLLYELLTGQPPFEGDSPVSLAYQHVRSTPVPPSEIDPLVSAQMDAVVLKSLAKAPADRYQTAHEMQEDISRLLTGQKVQVLIPPAVQDTPPETIAPADKTSVMPPPKELADAKGPARALEPEEEERSNLSKIIAIVLGVMLVIAMGAVVAVWAINRSPENTPTESSTVDMVAVPYMNSMLEANAIKMLEGKNLKWKVEKVNGPDDLTVGHVTSQDPKDGELVPVESEVTIWVNIGPEKFPITNVLGYKTEDARLLLSRTFTNVVVQRATEEAPDAQVGTIIKVDPPVGLEVAKDAVITIYYATGEAKMPDLVGFNLEQANKEMQRLGFTAGLTPIEQESTKKAGTIIDMNPKAGTVVAKDTPVKVWIAKAPETPTPTPTETCLEEPC